MERTFMQQPISLLMQHQTKVFTVAKMSCKQINWTMDWMAKTGPSQRCKFKMTALLENCKGIIDRSTFWGANLM